MISYILVNFISNLKDKMKPDCHSSVRKAYLFIHTEFIRHLFASELASHLHLITSVKSIRHRTNLLVI